MLKKVLLPAALISCANSKMLYGYIYADNYFEFYFNGKLIKKDPLNFTPHQACKVEFEWDGTSDKVFAFVASDYASSSGYEYAQSSRGAQLGDGAFIAWFSDGTISTGDWKTFTTSFGPTDVSKAAGCGPSNLAACKIDTTAAPTDWMTPKFDDSTWAKATTYTEAAAGWGRPPTWSGGKCSQSTSPFTSESLSFSAGNVDANGVATEVTVTEDDCLDPQDKLSNKGATFIWGPDLERDNGILLRHNAGNKDTVSAVQDSSMNLFTCSTLILSLVAILQFS